MKKRNNNSQSGFSLIESLTAAAIFVIGIIGITAMITMSNQVIENAAVRDQLTLTSTMALENIITDSEKISDYGTNNCYQAVGGSEESNKHKNRWFNIMKDKARIIGKIPSSQKKCSIITSEQKKNSNNGHIVKFEIKITTPDQKDRIVRKMIRRINGKFVQ